MVKKSPENTTPAIVDNVEALEAKLAQMREAQALFATYTQEQVDKIFYEAAMAANKARIPLAKMAIEETGRGVLEDKVIKNHYAAEYIYNAYKNTKTCGVLERDEAYGITKIAEPIGIVGAVIPTTNPTSTAIFKTLISLKTRNAIIIKRTLHGIEMNIVEQLHRLRVRLNRDPRIAIVKQMSRSPRFSIEILSICRQRALHCL